MAIQITITCSNDKCKSNNIVRNGKQPNGTQRYLCKDCSNSFSEAPRKVNSADYKKMVAEVHKNTNKSFREIAAIFDISHQTVKNWVKAYSDK